MFVPARACLLLQTLELPTMPASFISSARRKMSEHRLKICRSLPFSFGTNLLLASSIVPRLAMNDDHFFGLTPAGDGGTPNTYQKL